MTTISNPRIRLRNVLPQFDPRSWVAYVVLGLLGSAAYLGLMLADLRFSVSWSWALSDVAMVLIFVAWMLRRAGHFATSSGLETIGLAYLVSMAGLVVQYPQMALPMPFTDDLLSRIDHALGFDWWAFLQLFSHPWLWVAVRVSYGSVALQTLLLLILLCSTGREDRAWKFLTAASLAMAVTMIIFPFFPADGSLVLCSLPPDNSWVVESACYYGPVIHQLKAGELRDLGESLLVGLVSFPSFHTAIAVQFAWGFWPYKWLRWPMVFVSALNICGTIVVGSHYLVDVLAGAPIGLLAVKVAARIIGRTSAHRFRNWSKANLSDASRQSATTIGRRPV